MAKDLAKQEVLVDQQDSGLLGKAFLAEVWSSACSRSKHQFLRDALQATGNALLTASGRGRSGALKVFSAKTSTKSTLREILPSGQAKARNGLCLPSTMRLPIDWALVMWIVMGKTLFTLV